MPDELGPTWKELVLAGATPREAEEARMCASVGTATRNLLKARRKLITEGIPAPYVRAHVPNLPSFDPRYLAFLGWATILAIKTMREREGSDFDHKTFQKKVRGSRRHLKRHGWKFDFKGWKAVVTDPDGSVIDGTAADKLAFARLIWPDIAGVE